MKKDFKTEMEDELRPEYNLRELLKGGVRGKYAERYRAGTNLVLLAPDVAEAFPTEEAVNQALRLVIELTKLPSRKKRGIAKKQEALSVSIKNSK
jgi:hypothetical protein